MISSSSVRQNIALILIGIAVASLGCYLYHRHQVIQAQGGNPTLSSLLFSRANGSDAGVILSQAQANELGVLQYLFGASLLLGIALATQATQVVNLVTCWLSISMLGMNMPWLHSYQRDAIEEAYPEDPGTYGGSPIFFFAALILSSGGLWLSISPLASLLIRNGIVLRPW